MVRPQNMCSQFKSHCLVNIHVYVDEKGACSQMTIIFQKGTASKEELLLNWCNNIVKLRICIHKKPGQKVEDLCCPYCHAFFHLNFDYSSSKGGVGDRQPYYKQTIVVRFWSAPRSRHVFCLIRISRRQMTRCANKTSSEASSRRSRDHSSFRRLNCPETTPPSENIAIPRSIFPVLGKTNATTNLLDHCLHLWRSLCHQIIQLISNVQQLLLPCRLLQKIARTTPATNSTIHAITKKSQRANYAVMKIHMTRIINSDSQGIYTLRVGRRWGSWTTSPTEKKTNHSSLYQRL